jgi:glycosyltransferase involved in cell wall biosynthesis
MVLMTRKHFRAAYHFVHIHSVPDFLVFTALFPRLSGAKLVLDIHDLLPEFYASKFGSGDSSFVFRSLALVERLSGAFVHHVIAANDLWLERLVSRSFERSKCSAMVNVPDLKLFARQGRTRSDDRFVILYPGSLNWHQGLDLAIRAFAMIKDQVPRTEFHIYGEGPTRESLGCLIEELRLSDRVLLKNPMSTRDIASVIENADLGVVPKRRDGFGDEAFSTKIMEFMALGVPVIVADTRVDTYYFDDSVVKFFSAGDEKSLADAMFLLINNSSIRASLISNASSFVGRQNWDAMEADYLALVDSLVNQSSRESEVGLERFN